MDLRDTVELLAHIEIAARGEEAALECTYCYHSYEEPMNGAINEDHLTRMLEHLRTTHPAMNHHLMNALDPAPSQDEVQTAIDSIQKVSTQLPCCNEIEQKDGTAPLCDGLMDLARPEYVCRKCRGRCGYLVHPTHAPRRNT